MGESGSQRNLSYYAQNDPVFTTPRAAHVIHMHFEIESVVYQVCSLSFHAESTELECRFALVQFSSVAQSCPTL